MKFNVPDFMSETYGWDDELVGIYIKLICHQWLRGSIPKPDMLARTSPKAAERFAEIEHLFVNGKIEWVENVRQEAIDMTEARRRGGLKRAKQLKAQRKQQRHDHDDD